MGGGVESDLARFLRSLFGSAESAEQEGAATPVPVVKIAGPLTIESVTQVRLTLLRELAASAVLRCDLGEVGACDSAGIQLLCAAARSAAAAGGALTVGERSPAVLEAARRMGLGGQASGQP